MFSLRKWGCCLTPDGLGLSVMVFPTQVGVLLIHWRISSLLDCFPYASGGVALTNLWDELVCVFSLRKWGCCFFCPFPCLSWTVFPTQVGVLLLGFSFSCGLYCFPYASGGVASW